MIKEKIYIGSDHAGFELKEEIKKVLTEENYEVEDLGPYEYDFNDDYPDYAVKVCEKVLETSGRGILICGSGQGMDRVANKIPGIHAAVCWDETSAKMAKEHGNVNVLCFGEKTVKPELAKKMVKIWLETPFTPKEKHIRRISKIKEIEKKYMKK
ncbi:MAG: ribose 5-phosphate isomerase B [Nanoarchaeota archaeon]|nr:ribose 5-phosphate isomerase B [Nanoarchaeota archaeon]